MVIISVTVVHNLSQLPSSLSNYRLKQDENKQKRHLTAAVNFVGDRDKEKLSEGDRRV